MNRNRRIILQTLTLGGVAWLALGAPPLALRSAWAAWPKALFATRKLDDALQALLAGQSAEMSTAITLKLPEVAENGAIVPITVGVDLPNVETISLLAEHNPVPWIATFTLTPAVLPELTTRIKMAETEYVIAVVKAGGKLYTARKKVEVAVGGCGA